MSDNKKTFTLYTAPTPNGYSPSILLEELKLLYPSITYEPISIDLSKKAQKEPWFLKLNPNGRIPVVVDHQRDDYVVFETSAIMLYIAQHYDTDFHFWFDPAKDANSYSDMLQWIFFTHGAVGPVTVQLAHFILYASEDIPYAKKRYLNETKRLYGVLNGYLKDREYLAGPGKGKYSLADIKTVPWIEVHYKVEIENLEEFPHLKAYLERCKIREGTQAGFKVPEVLRLP
ncbi:glutathione S-transferase [Amanita rubescens]|nr:glutathione S-transferase [Amanita rubescens]